MNKSNLVLLIAIVGITTSAFAEDWPFWGRDGSRNMVSPEKGIITDFDPGKYVSPDSEEIDIKTTRNVKWVVKLGSQSYGNPTVAGGKVFVGTNNDAPHHKLFKDDRSLAICFDEKTGKFLWQLTVPKLGSGKVSDWEYLGICSSPAVEGDRVYLVTNRCEVICLDVNGMANGNQGYDKEGQYMAGPGKPPVEVGPNDADIIWRFDIRDELGVFPHNITVTSILVVGDRLYGATSNGVDWTHSETPAPNAPAFWCVDKKTGKLAGEEFSGISQGTLHSNWSSPAYGEVDGKGVVILPGGDGFMYGVDPKPVFDKDEELNVLKELWKIDGNPVKYRKDPKTGKVLKYASGGKGPSEFISTPVFHKGRIYAAIGQDPEHGEGYGNMLCIDAKTGKAIWQNDKIERAISTCAVHEGLVYIADYTGYVYCFDADTGKIHWKHDTQAHIWPSPLVVDGQVIIGNEDGILTVLATGKEKKLIREIELDSPVYSSCIAANGTLYLATHTHLYAIGKK